ncbi:MAG: protelomerase family protein [Proteobacteria bacterium]|nr:protelomerase family protein [Pseudomonadota bacterium]
MTTKNITPTALGKMIAAESIKDRSYLKEIFDSVESYELLQQSIIKALGFLGQVEQDEAAKKLTSYVRHYFAPTTYDYPEDDTYELKNATEHTIEVLTKWADKIDAAVKAKESIKGFNRFIHRSVAALATRLNKIEDVGVRKAHFQIASYKVNQAFFEYGYVTQDTIKQALAKISAELGVTDAIISVGEESTEAPQASGVSIYVEIKHTNQIISNIYNHFDQKIKKLDGVYIAQLKRAINALKIRICAIEKLTTRYEYMSRARIGINKYIKNFDEDFAALVHNDLALLKDEQAMQYKNNQYKAKVALRNTTENSKTHLKLNIKDAKQIFEEVESEMIQQMQPARYQSWAKLCLSICLMTGRRLYEVCVTGNFEIVNAHTMKMTGIAKQKNDDDKENKSIEFKVFTNSHLIMQAITVLRDIKDFSVYGDDYRKFDKSTGTPLRVALHPQRENQVAMICNPAVTIKLLPKSMRQLYAAMVKHEIEQAKPNESDNFYDFELAKHLGHDAERDIDTVQSYKDIVVY